MLRSVKKLEGLTIGASDGAIGKVKDFYFDDEAWVVRYLVVDTGHWLAGREVLISPYSIGQVAWESETLPVNLTKAQIKNSPDIDTARPVSRQFERNYYAYYGYPYYWGGMGLWGGGYYPEVPLVGSGGDSYEGHRGHLRAPNEWNPDADPHLRSCNAVKGYNIRATDGDIGHVQGFIIEDATWAIRYLIVNTSNWWVGHEVLVSPEWITDVNWSQSVVSIDVDQKAIRNSPAYDPAVSLGRELEGALYRHYGRSTYWRDPLARAVA
jgi:uncharacterized protein YrrD